VLVRWIPLRSASSANGVSAGFSSHPSALAEKPPAGRGPAASLAAARQACAGGPGPARGPSGRISARWAGVRTVLAGIFVLERFSHRVGAGHWSKREGIL